MPCLDKIGFWWQTSSFFPNDQHPILRFGKSKNALFFAQTLQNNAKQDRTKGEARGESATALTNKT
jgi:hypothetical protein